MKTLVDKKKTMELPTLINPMVKQGQHKESYMGSSFPDDLWHESGVVFSNRTTYDETTI